MKTHLLHCLLLVMVLSTMLGYVGSCDFAESVCGAEAPGDIKIGIMMPCHRKVQALHDRTRPDGFGCTDFDLVPFMTSLGVIHTIEEINAKGFLPGVRLGYMMCDTCSDATKALHIVGHMMAVNGSLSVQCNYTDFRPPVKAIIGARYSEVSIALAKMLSVYMVPQVSCTSSSPALSDKVRYPAFMRLIPSDVHQTKAFAKLVARFGWNYVGVVYGDDDYGKAAFQSFISDVKDVDVCVAYQEVVPHYLDHENSMQRIKQVAQAIRSSKAKVVVLILKPELVGDLFKEMILTKTTRTWIASDSWGMNRLLAHMDGINEVGDIFGFTFISRESTSFDDYLKNLRPTPGGHNQFIRKYKNLRFNCTPECFSNNPPSYCPSPEYLKIKSEFACDYDDPQEANDDFLVTALDTSESYLQRASMWAIAHALKELLQCDDNSCPGELDFPPWKLLEKLKKVNFELDGQKFFFNNDGDSVDGYDLIMWEKAGAQRSFDKKGGYHISSENEGQIEISREIYWLSTPNNKVPESRCSPSCSPGSEKKILDVVCCYNCVPCGVGTFADKPDLDKCHHCPNGTWSLTGWDHCEERIETYLKWNDPHPIVLVVSAVIGVLLLSAVLFIFLKHRNTPPMKRAEVKLSCAMMAGLAVSFASVICFIGRPNVHLCRARQMMYGMGFTLCVSCILVKAFRTFLAFLPFGQITHRRLNRLYVPPAIVSVITILQGIICILWLIFDSPDVEVIEPKQNMQLIIKCAEGPTYIGFGVMLGYIALLALVGFFLAFKGRRVPQRFSETGYIIFSMLMYLFVWVCFIPVYIVKETQDGTSEDPLVGSSVQASAILVSSYGVIFCHFLPKCYEVLWGSNVDELEHILPVVSGRDIDLGMDRDSGGLTDNPLTNSNSQSTTSIQRLTDNISSVWTLESLQELGTSQVWSTELGTTATSSEEITVRPQFVIQSTCVRQRIRSISF